MESKHHNYSSPTSIPPSSLLKDISNFRTPKHNYHHSLNPKFNSPHSSFFTATKQTPKSSTSSLRRPSLAPSRTKSKAARRLKAFEVEQNKSARKSEINKEKSLKSLAKSLTVWLNFLFQNPKSCGCDLSKFNGEDQCGDVEVSANGKRDSWPGGGVGVDRPWRGPKRHRDLSWRQVADEETTSLSNSKFTALQSSLRETCSFDDLKERMSVYLSLQSCREIFDVMTQVTKNIDDGRLKMKVHCPIVTDVGMKEKATRILMSFNPIWLRIGLHIILGGDSLLPSGDVNSDQEIAFLKLVIEKQFFSHAGLSKAYAYNKLVEGLYRPGYFEKLGNVVLKRFLLLLLILDRAKSQSTLPINYGIDGSDGGSPPLFISQSNIKSTHQVVSDFLSSDVMHGEGNLLTHLAIVGYKLSYHQSPLSEYDFRMKDLFEDLEDGIRLCRAVQLLQQDSSILTKMAVPADTRKKKMVNCSIALQHLKQAGVPLNDEDGTVILAEDVVNGDKELTLSLMWNIFVYMQLPLLINQTLLSEEILKIRGVGPDYSSKCTLLDMLLTWIQAICQSYDFRVENFASLVDGKAMWCLLDYYFRMEYNCSCAFQDHNETNGEFSIMSSTDYTDAVHNFILSQKLPSLLGNFPEVLQVSDILEHNGASNDRSVVILLGFLSFQLVVKQNTEQLNFHKFFGFNCQSRERKCLSTERLFAHSEEILHREETGWKETEDTVRSFKAIMSWWQDMAKQNNKCDLKQPPVGEKQSTHIQREDAAKVIQFYFRRSSKYCNYIRRKRAILLLQPVIRTWLIVKKKNLCNSLSYDKYTTYMVDRHDFVKLKKSTIIIQHATRAWLSKRRKIANLEMKAATKIQSFVRGWVEKKRFQEQKKAVVKIQSVLRSIKCRTGFQYHKLAKKSAIIIQAHFRGWIVRRRAHSHKYFTIIIQHATRAWLSKRRKIVNLEMKAATKIQNFVRAWVEKKRFQEQKKAVVKIQSVLRSIKCRTGFQYHKLAKKSAIIIQAHFRGWIVRRRAHSHKYFTIIIQSHCRGWLVRKEILCQTKAATQIQRFIRGRIIRKQLTGSFPKQEITGCILLQTGEIDKLNLIIKSTLKLQRWWKCTLVVKSRKIKSAIIIQSHIRGWLVRSRATREKRRIVLIQSIWKGYCARKESKKEVMDLRLRVQKSAANVDDGMRIINRLIAALSELLNIKSVSGILHTCATLDMATQHSKKCCEELVAAGAVETLLTLICSVSRSIPDQEVLKHALSTLRNLARYPHLAQILITTPKSLQTILCEFFRNKEEGYFVASELLKRICLNKSGVEAIRSSPFLVKRLHGLVEDLTRKSKQFQQGRDRNHNHNHYIERRLKEASQVLKMISG